MRWLILLVAILGAYGCEDKPSSAKQDDPTIKAQRTIVHPGGGANVGPVGGGYHHGGKSETYEGPASKAPAWAK